METDKQRFERLDKLRKKAKVVNYSSLYGVGKAKLSRSSGMSIKEAEALLKAFWELNWSIKEVADSLKVKTVDGQMWVHNPVSGFWYALRYDKDKFSTLNQGTGVYCFDTWLAYYLLKRPNIVGQFHDESINCLPDNETEKQAHTAALRWAIDKTNQKLKLNIDLDIDVQYGYRYSEIH
jgi:DNA polymerase I-like protein with 3'-5' exonuclease and polymerase domains